MLAYRPHSLYLTPRQPAGFLARKHHFTAISTPRCRHLISCIVRGIQVEHRVVMPRLSFVCLISASDSAPACTQDIGAPGAGRRRVTGGGDGPHLNRGGRHRAAPRQRHHRLGERHLRLQRALHVLRRAQHPRRGAIAGTRRHTGACGPASMHLFALLKSTYAGIKAALLGHQQKVMHAGSGRTPSVGTACEIVGRDMNGRSAGLAPLR